MSPRRLVAHVFVPLWLVASAAAARAQDAPSSAATGDIDDPKVARRLGTRVELGAPSPEGAPGLVAPAAEPAGAAAPPRSAQPPETDLRDTGARAEAPRRPNTPRLKLGYRYFTFAQIGAKADSGPGKDESFNVLSLDLYPVSSGWRFGLTTQYGWESGTFRQGGDAFVAESLSLGGQLPGAVATPFFEVYGGGGLMQRTHAGLNAIASVYGQYGLDVGVDVFLARYLCMSFAFGYVHPANGFVKEQAYGSFSADTWSFKVGVGL